MAIFHHNLKFLLQSHIVTILVCCSLGLLIIGILLFLAYVSSDIFEQFEQIYLQKVFISKRNPGENSGEMNNGSGEKKKRTERLVRI